MTLTPRFIVVVAFLTLSACESVNAPLNKKGLYLNAGAALAKVRLTVPCPTPYACGVSPTVPLEQRHALGWELGAGYRFNRFLSLQVDSLFAVSGGNADLHVPLQDTAADVRAGLVLRPSLRADLPLSQRWSLYATYGLQYENFSASLNVPTGAVQTLYTQCDQYSPPSCTPGTPYQSKVTAMPTFYHRDWHPTATVGADWYFMNSRSLRLEYLPRGNGRVGALTAGVSWHW